MLALSACGKTALKVGVVANDTGSLAAIVARDSSLPADNGMAWDVIVYPDAKSLESAVRSGEIDAAYGDAKGLLAIVAKREAELAFVSIASRTDFRPDRIFVVNGKFADAKKIKSMAAIHRAATRMLLEKTPDAIKSARAWLGIGLKDADDAVSGARFESAIDRAALIGILDDLRREGTITPAQSEALASRLVKEEGEAGKP